MLDMPVLFAATITSVLIFYRKPVTRFIDRIKKLNWLGISISLDVYDDGKPSDRK
jgi:hypothetical protein